MRKILSILFVLVFITAFTEEKKTVCLNMIVKNERDVIEKCLGSVKNLIDYWVIFDTGSTDGTQEIIKNFMKDKPGKLYEAPWVNFAHNRNEAMLAAKEKADYLFFIDADEVLEFSDNFKLPNLNKDYYYINVRQLNAANFLRIGLISNKLNWQWKGIIHEALECPEAKTWGKLEGVINICNASVGGRSKVSEKEKYLKDALTLEEALKSEPNNSRYLYYLGVSYQAAGELEKALDAFKRRVSVTSNDIQETFMALYNCGMLSDNLKDFNSAIDYYLQAFHMRKTRAEPLFQLATIYRRSGNYLLGYLIAKHALAIPYPSEDLCIDYTIYDYRLLIEYANNTLLMGYFSEGLDACKKLLANPQLPEEIKGAVTSNYQLALKNVFCESVVK